MSLYIDWTYYMTNYYRLLFKFRVGWLNEED